MEWWAGSPPHRWRLHGPRDMGSAAALVLLVCPTLVLLCFQSPSAPRSRMQRLCFVEEYGGSDLPCVAHTDAVLSPLEQHGPAAGGGADPDPGAPAEQRISTEVTQGRAPRRGCRDAGSRGRGLTAQERDVRSRRETGLERAFEITQCLCPERRPAVPH